MNNTIRAHLDDACAKLNADGVRAVSEELLLSELMQNAGLAHAHVTDDDVFEDVRIVLSRHVCGWHGYRNRAL